MAALSGVFRAGVLISVGYMDPGNWGTDLQAGSKFGHRLLWVLLMSNLMALLLQSLATRLGVVTGRDLAQACRESYPRRRSSACGFSPKSPSPPATWRKSSAPSSPSNCFSACPTCAAWLIAAGDTFLLLALQQRGVRLLEMVTLALVGGDRRQFRHRDCAWPGPTGGRWCAASCPALDPDNRRESLYVAIGMLGATVMPHNLYLHSALVQTRAFPQTTRASALACKYNFFDSLLALNGAFFVNAAILVLGGD